MQGSRRRREGAKLAPPLCGGDLPWWHGEGKICRRPTTCLKMNSHWDDRSNHELQVIRERKWKDVTATFNFPSTATNASFVLRKYYVSLLQHYEQIYFFKARGWTFIPQAGTVLLSRTGQELIAASIQSPTLPMAQFSRMDAAPTAQHNVRTLIQQPSNSHGELPRATLVLGVIDGKIDEGYLITVWVGSEILKGVLYHIPQTTSPMIPQSQSGSFHQALAPLGTVNRRRRRKKSEMKRRDPAHPKPNRSGYNFFFKEQHARLKPLHPGKDREISRMIGQLWNNLKDHERAVYQEKAAEDKERYRAEMVNYREKQRLGQVMSDAVPLQQWLREAGNGTEEVEGDSPQYPCNGGSSGKSDSGDMEDESFGFDEAGESSNEMTDTEGPPSLVESTAEKVQMGQAGKVEGHKAAAADAEVKPPKVDGDGEGSEKLEILSL
ncbi:hypothetical protein SAY87_027056 [Trapa incisa]|uniref:Uncharacterized protein n=1 Tax=Trapa incisa TaxID=236973 RepID=A0AAN7H4D6_9MYRT|nr:hypothetical protein SAY87_027056 [Trapa incisa]